MFAEVNQRRIKDFLPKEFKFLMSKIGFVEILPEENSIAQGITWSAYLGRSLFRLGEKGKFLYDPDDSLSNFLPNTETSSLYRQAINRSLHGDFEGLNNIFTNPDALVLAKGTLRRIFSNRDSKKILMRELKGKPRNSQKPDNIDRLYAIIQREHERLIIEETDNGKPNILLVAHSRLSPISMLYDGGDALRPGQEEVINSVQKASIGIPAVLQRAVVASTVPHLATAVIDQELRKTDLVGRIKMVDYSDVLDGSWREKIGPNFDFKQVMMVGATSFDTKTIIDSCKELEKEGKQILIGGILADLDPAVLALETKADIFSGEIEGAGTALVKTIFDKDSSKRLMIHRGSFRLQRDPNAPPTALEEKFLDLSQFVDMDKYYSYDQEQMNLADRLRFLNKYLPPAQLFGKKWDAPAWLRFSQIDARRGCPWGCEMCSTAKSQGPHMRSKSVEVLNLEMLASESWGMIALDQNSGGQESSTIEPDDYWYRWMEGFFQSALDNEKKVFLQTDLDFFGSVIKSTKLTKLVRKTLRGYLSGVEAPVAVKGNPKKNLEHQEQMIKIAKQFSALGIATAVFGLRDENNNLPTYEDWRIMLEKLSPDVLLVFPKLKIPGIPGIPQTDYDDEDSLKRYQKKYEDGDAQGAIEVATEYYTWDKIMKRLIGILESEKGVSLLRIGEFLVLSTFVKVFLDRYKQGYYEYLFKIKSI
ncbi:hypothetical protein HZA76_04700 [Candidatus Roizmanbacteria bacterium]|nr:hypothetical protein [Candidatus Roizmanbacteria bacterium]